MTTQIQFKRGAAADLTALNPLLASGEPCYEVDTGQFKIGDGETAWNDLAYQQLTGATGPQGPSGASYTNVVNTPSQITANQNNYSLPAGADIVRLATNAAREITGIAAGSVDGQSVLLLNVGTFNITLKHQNTGSTAANRFIVPWAADYVLAANGGAALIVYDNTDARWRII